MDLPAVSLKNGLPLAVAFAGGAGGVVASSIAFDPNEVATRLGGIDDGEIDIKTARTDLGMNGVTFAFEGPFDGSLEGGSDSAVGLRIGGAEDSGFGVLQKRFQGDDPRGAGAVEVDLAGEDRAKDLAPPFGTGNQDIQPAFASFPVKGAEVHAEKAVGILGVADRNEDAIAFVALNVFEIFDKEGFVGVGVKEGLGVGVFGLEAFEFVEDGVALADGEGGNAEALVGPAAGVFDHGTGDGGGFDRIAHRFSAVKDAIGDVVKAETEVGIPLVRGGDDEEAAVVELVV